MLSLTPFETRQTNIFGWLSVISLDSIDRSSKDGWDYGDPSSVEGTFK